MKIRRQIVKNRSKTSPGKNPGLYITVHETGNTSRGANAAAHANLQSRGNVRNASWHIQVDDKEAVRSFPNSVRCWHAGDGTGPGNYSSIGIEICVNSDGDYEMALQNAADVVRRLRRKKKIPRERVVQHNHWSGKNCPTRLRSRGAKEWNEFVASTDPKTVKKVVESVVKRKTIKKMATEVIQGKHGTGHAARRKSLGISAKRYKKVRAEVNRRLR